MSFSKKVSFTAVLGHLLARMRIIKRKKQQELSDSIGFNNKFLSNFELGKSQLSFNNLIYLASQLDIDINLLLRLINIYLKQTTIKGVYVYLSNDDISLANTQVVKNVQVLDSYHFIYDFFGLSQSVSRAEFEELEVIASSELEAIMKNSNLSEKFEDESYAYNLGKLEKEIKELEERKNIQLDRFHKISVRNLDGLDLIDEEIKNLKFQLVNKKRKKRQLVSRKVLTTRTASRVRKSLNKNPMDE